MHPENFPWLVPALPRALTLSLSAMNVSPSLKLSDADIPPLPPKLNRRDYSTDAAFSAAQAQRAEVTQQRRKLKEKLRD